MLTCLATDPCVLSCTERVREQVELMLLAPRDHGDYPTALSSLLTCSSTIRVNKAAIVGLFHAICDDSIHKIIHFPEKFLLGRRHVSMWVVDLVTKL